MHNCMWLWYRLKETNKKYCHSKCYKIISCSVWLIFLHFVVCTFILFKSFFHKKMQLYFSVSVIILFFLVSFFFHTKQALQSAKMQLLIRLNRKMEEKIILKVKFTNDRETVNTICHINDFILHHEYTVYGVRYTVYHWK